MPEKPDCDFRHPPPRPNAAHGRAWLEILALFRHSAALVLPYRCLVCSRRLWQASLCMRCTPLIPFFAARCPRCFTPQAAGGVCLLCRLIPLPFGAARYLWDYEQAARRLIHAMKYAPSPRLCTLAGRLLAAGVPALQLPAGYDLVVPIPSSRASLRKRGFNQCELIVSAFARMALPSTPIAVQALADRRSDATHPAGDVGNFLSHGVLLFVCVMT